jgi:integrase
MITIRARAEEYLAMRRKLGFKLGTFARYLMLFVAYLEQTGATVVTTQTALAWATEATSSTDRAYLNRRLMIVRIFARHLQMLEPATEVPPEDLLPHHGDRITPYLFTPNELDALLAAAGRLRPAFRALTYRTLFALLAVTGLRVGEACHLDRTDVDLNSGVLTVRDSKFGKSRQVPVHDSTTAALADYRHQRDQRPNAQTNPAFLISIMGTRLRPKTMSIPFAKLVDAVGITVAAGQHHPRQHDLRHTFATATLLDWYRQGVDVQARLPLLATYLGHADPKSTYWYLSGSPELLALAAERLEDTFGGQP